MAEIDTRSDNEKAKEISDKIVKTVKEFHADFKCLNCGKCCQEGVGVALWAHEFHRLKKIRKDIYKHIVMLGNWYALKLPCVFYDKLFKRCKIYKTRPIACRMYPLGISPDGSSRISGNCSKIKLTTKEV